MITTNAPTLVRPAATARLPALDAARAFALLIGIVYHGMQSLTFMKYFSVAQDTQGSLVLDGVYYIFHIFRMQLFFLMSGFFAHLLYHRRGWHEFTVNRAKRLLLPFLLFWPLNYLLVTGLWLWNIQRNNALTLAQAFAKLPPEYRLEHGVPLLHLWFLYFLILLCAGVTLLRPMLDYWEPYVQPIRSRADQALAWIMGRWWSSLAMAVLMLAPMQGMTDNFGVDTPDRSLLPRWAPYLIYALYFGFGWLLHRQPNLLTNFLKFKLVNLALSLAFVAVLFAIKIHYDFGDPRVGYWLVPLHNFVYAFASMSAVFAFLGLALALFSGPSPVIRYLSDASYWSYLMHYPVLIYFQTLVAPYAWHWSIKLLLILGPTFLLLGLTYQGLVRRTWLGQLLNGRVHGPVIPVGATGLAGRSVPG